MAALSFVERRQQQLTLEKLRDAWREWEGEIPHTPWCDVLAYEVDGICCSCGADDLAELLDDL